MVSSKGIAKESTTRHQETTTKKYRLITSRQMTAALVILSMLCASSLKASDTSSISNRTALSTENSAKFELGRLLFFDKVLSGNKDISCATCHHPFTHSSDGLSLPLGAGALGLSVTRNAPPVAGALHRVPRNSPALFNLGEPQFVRLFHDGRIEVAKDQPSGFISPAGERLPLGLDNILAAQAMFPVQSNTEMAGDVGTNAVANAAAAGRLTGQNGVWALLTARIAAIPDYVAHFVATFDDIDSKHDIRFVHVANSIAAFEATAFSSLNSPFDRFMRGDKNAMSANAQRGLELFYGPAGCAGCHRSYFQTDHEFHSIGIPPIGPGKGDGPSGLDDFGRERVTLDRADRYRFRTPSLRNVALTGPWGHSGAYNNLTAMLRHHLNPAESIANYDPSQAVLPNLMVNDDFLAVNDPAIQSALTESVDITPRVVTKTDIAYLNAFLHSLTDESMLDLRHLVPKTVPSGLPIQD